MKSKIALSLLTLPLMLASVASEKRLPEGTLKDGSLSNQQLISDAKVGVASQVAILGCNKPEKVNFYVTQMPKGKVGSRIWKELWIVEGCKKKFPVKVRFQEDPTGAVWTIEK